MNYPTFWIKRHCKDFKENTYSIFKQSCNLFSYQENKVIHWNDMKPTNIYLHTCFTYFFGSQIHIFAHTTSTLWPIFFSLHVIPGANFLLWMAIRIIKKNKKLLCVHWIFCKFQEDFDIVCFVDIPERNAKYLRLYAERFTWRLSAVDLKRWFTIYWHKRRIWEHFACPCFWWTLSGTKDCKYKKMHSLK